MTEHVATPLALVVAVHFWEPLSVKMTGSFGTGALVTLSPEESVPRLPGGGASRMGAPEAPWLRKQATGKSGRYARSGGARKRRQPSPRS